MGNDGKGKQAQQQRLPRRLRLARQGCGRYYCSGDVESDCRPVGQSRHGDRSVVHYLFNPGRQCVTARLCWKARLGYTAAFLEPPDFAGAPQLAEFTI